MQRLFIAPVLALVLVAAVGCGSSDSGGSSTTTASSSAAAEKQPAADTTAATAGAAAIGTTKGDLGTFLVDDQSRTLYLWEKDTGSTSECDGACAQAWPPVVSKGAPTATGDADASMLGTSKRADGTMQVTYAGHPLYTFVGDKSAGQTAGQGSDGFGAEWYVVAPSGQKIEGAEDSGKSDDATDDNGGGGGGGGGGY